MKTKIASWAPAKTRTSSAADPLVQRGDLRPQLRVAGGLGVAQAQGGERLGGSRLHGQQLAQGKGLAIRGAQVVRQR